MPIAADVLVEFDIHQAILGQGMGPPGLRFTRFEKAQRLRHGHLVNHDLPLAKRCFRNPVTGLNDGSAAGSGGGFDARGSREKAADANGIAGVIGTLVDHFEDIIGANERSRQLNPAGAPPVGKRHLAAAEGDLISGNGNGFQNGPPDHALGLFIQIGEIVAFHARPHHCGAAKGPSAEGPAFLSAPPHPVRIRTSSAWKST